MAEPNAGHLSFHPGLPNFNFPQVPASPSPGLPSSAGKKATHVSVKNWKRTARAGGLSPFSVANPRESLRKRTSSPEDSLDDSVKLNKKGKTNDCDVSSSTPRLAQAAGQPRQHQ
jgi:hypothetical protein